jgi:uncharacterized membrane protein
VPQILIAGESWVTHSIHVKGFDSFTTSAYEEGVGWLRQALTGAGHQVRFLPNHEASAGFPTSAAALAAYDLVILSDIGSNTLLLHPETFARSASFPNRLALLRDFVAAGGGLIMIGGYLSFQGIDGKARYHGTPIEAALPVTLEAQDDRVEAPEGLTPVVRLPAHPLVRGLDATWPAILGYNRLHAKPAGEVVVTAGEDPLVVAWSFEQGRSLAFASDCGPHWAPPPFVSWPGYARFWANAAAWLTGREDR